MTTWIALLRGVNVGGHNTLPMKALRTLLTDLGFANVATYIQSGNCVFDSGASDAAEIAGRISDRIEAEFGFRPNTFVLSLDALEAAIAGNPFAGQSDDPKYVHLFFLADEVGDLDEPGMRALAAPGDDFALVGKVFYLLTPAGIGRNKLANKLDRFLKVYMTARNLRSTAKIANLARSIDN